MSTSLTAAVARLHRAGSEQSQQTKKLRVAVDTLLTWIKDNVKTRPLPCNCDLNPSGEFERTKLSNPPLGMHVPILKITIGQEHSIEVLHGFAKLIADGFLEELCKDLEEDAETFRNTSNKVENFLQKR